ncbi:hypothetical protein [Streptomyces antimycoticus]|uniref:hypothetical protein n=1 Tax=Streptomyces antimycoticus TaxID=68175 RepID=UPI0033E74FC5
MSAFTVAAAIAALDGADWLPPTTHWEIATTDGVWGAHCEIAADTEAEAHRILRAVAERHGAELADDSRLLAVDFAYDEVPVRAWWLRPVKRWSVPEQCATCPTKLGEPDVSFVRLGVGADAPVICVPCRDRMHARWVKGDAARDAEVLREAKAEVVAWLGKKASEYRATGTRQREADAVSIMASKVARGAVRCFLSEATEGQAPSSSPAVASLGTPCGACGHSRNWHDGACVAGQTECGCPRFVMADEAGKVTRKGEISQPADTCDRCRQPFDPSDARFDGRARHLYSPFCRRCVDRCHESSDAFHVCAVCRAPAESGDSRG